jgi:hypothetical protein
MTGQEDEFEIMGKKITVPQPPDPPKFPWEGGKENSAKPKRPVRRFVRRKNQKWD